MKRFRIGFDLMLAGMLCVFLALPASANSSWRWISETRPCDILPFVIAATLAIEITAVMLSLEERKLWKVLFFVTLGNLLSFGAPYLVEYLIYSHDGFPFEHYLDGWPSYTVGFFFLVVTLAVEYPIVWFSLHNDAKDEKRFSKVIILANTATTGLTWLAEHLFCRGSW